MDKDYDFGFSAVNAEDIAPAPSFDAELLESLRADYPKVVADLNKAIEMVMPLLNRLKDNPEKDYIYWPNRTGKIDDFIKKLNKLKK